MQAHNPSQTTSNSDERDATAQIDREDQVPSWCEKTDLILKGALLEIREYNGNLPADYAFRLAAHDLAMTLARLTDPTIGYRQSAKDKVRQLIKRAKAAQ